MHPPHSAGGDVFDLRAVTRGRPGSSPAVHRGHWSRGGLVRGRPFAAVGLAAGICVAFVALVVALGFGVVSVTQSWATGDDAAARSESAIAPSDAATLLKQGAARVEQRRDSLVAYSATLTSFKIAMARQPDALGLDAAEVRRREATLAGLVLECINEVNLYNVDAQNATTTQTTAVGRSAALSAKVLCTSSQSAGTARRT